MTIEEFKEKTFDFLLIARSKDITAKPENHIVCPRRRCRINGNSSNCGFIPNYPEVDLKKVAQGEGGWRVLADIEDMLNNFLDEKD